MNSHSSSPFASHQRNGLSSFQEVSHAFAGAETSIEVFRVVCDPGAIQHFDQLFAERFRSVMLVLIGDVALHRFPCVRADREGRVADLPSKRRQTDLLVYPDRRRFLQFALHVGQAMGRVQTDEKMDMIVHATNLLRKSAEACDRAAQVLV